MAGVKDSIGEPTLSLAARSSEERKTNARGLPLKETILHRTVKGICFFFFLCTYNTTELSCCCCFSRLATSRPLGERSEPCLGRPRATKSREVRRRSERSDGGLFWKSFVFNGGGTGGCYSRGALVVLVWWILVKGGRQLLVISVSIVQGEHLVPVSILWPDKISSRNRA